MSPIASDLPEHLPHAATDLQIRCRRRLLAESLSTCKRLIVIVVACEHIVHSRHGYDEQHGIFF